MRSVFPALLLMGSVGVAAAAGPSPWRTCHSQNGAFRISLPGKPAEICKPVSTQPDAPIMYIYHLHDRGVPYVAGSVHVPHDLLLSIDDRHLFDMVLEYAEKTYKIKVLYKQPYTFEGATGRRVKIKYPNGTVDEVRMVILGDYFYEWLAQTNPGGKSNPNAARFFDSFQVDPAVIQAAREQRIEQRAVEHLLAASQGPASSGWRPLQSQRGGFTVEMPAFLRYAKSQVSDPASPGAKATIYSAIAPGSRVRPEVYITGYAENGTLRPDGNSDQWLDEFRNSNSSRRGMHLTSSQDITVNGYPGREYRYVDASGFSEITRVVLADSRVYILTAIAPSERSYSDETMRFLRSFKLSAAAKAPVKTQRQPAVRRDTL